MVVPQKTRITCKVETFFSGCLNEHLRGRGGSLCETAWCGAKW